LTAPDNIDIVSRMSAQAWFRFNLPAKEADRIRQYCRKRGLTINWFCRETLLNKIKEEAERRQKNNK